MKKARTNSLKNAFLSAILIFVAPAGPAHAEAWKTIYMNDNSRYQINLKSITKQGSTVFANLKRTMNSGRLYGTIELELDCSEKISHENIFTSSDTLEFTYFMQNDGEWWSIYDVEKGFRDYTTVASQIFDMKEINKENDLRHNRFYDYLCRD